MEFAGSDLITLTSNDPTLNIFDVRTMKLKTTYLTKSSIECFAVGTSLMALCSANGAVEIHDLRNFPSTTGTIKTGVPLVAGDISTDDLLLAIGSDDIGADSNKKVMAKSDFSVIVIGYFQWKKAEDNDSDGSIFDDDVKSHLIFGNFY